MMADKGEDGINDGNVDAYRANFKERLERTRTRSKKDSTSTLRILVIFALLMIAAFLFLSK